MQPQNHPGRAGSTETAVECIRTGVRVYEAGRFDPSLDEYIVLERAVQLVWLKDNLCG